MGRVSRYKKIKACDPFSKTHGVVPVVDSGRHDLPLKDAEAEADRIPSRMRELMEHAAGGRSGGGSGGGGQLGKKSISVRDCWRLRPARASTRAIPPSQKMTRRPSESVRSFRRRLNAATSEQLAHLRASSGGRNLRPMRESRKAHLEARAEKKKQQLKASRREDDSDGEDSVVGGSGGRGGAAAGAGHVAASEPRSGYGALRAGAVSGSAALAPSAALAGHKRKRSEAFGETADGRGRRTGDGDSDDDGGRRTGGDYDGGGGIGVTVAAAAAAAKGALRAFPKDHIAFGERVTAPPDLRGLAPRKTKVRSIGAARRRPRGAAPSTLVLPLQAALCRLYGWRRRWLLRDASLAVAVVMQGRNRALKRLGLDDSPRYSRRRWPSTAPTSRPRTRR